MFGCFQHSHFSLDSIPWPWVNIFDLDSKTRPCLLQTLKRLAILSLHSQYLVQYHKLVSIFYDDICCWHFNFLLGNYTKFNKRQTPNILLCDPWTEHRYFCICFVNKAGTIWEPQTGVNVNDVNGIFIYGYIFSGRSVVIFATSSLSSFQSMIS